MEHELADIFYAGSIILIWSNVDGLARKTQLGFWNCICGISPGFFLYYLFDNILKEHWLLTIKLFRTTLDWIEVLGISEFTEGVSVNLELQGAFLLFSECWNGIWETLFVLSFRTSSKKIKIRSFIRYLNIVKIQPQWEKVEWVGCSLKNWI